MIYRIPPNKHDSRPFRIGFWFGRDAFRWEVRFDRSCRYMIQGDDQYDINKLIGIGFLPGHHTDSARFGWTYDVTTDKINIYAYCYVKKERVTRFITAVEIDKPFIAELHITPTSYVMKAGAGQISIHKDHSKSFCYLLTPWFGGNKRADHEMKIKIRPV